MLQQVIDTCEKEEELCDGKTVDKDWLLEEIRIFTEKATREFERQEVDFQPNTDCEKRINESFRMRGIDMTT